MIKFPRTLEAARVAENVQWRIGDALIAEAEADNSGRRGLVAVAAELAENGIDLSTNFLSR